MNLHEECLLKYLKRPDGISISTEILELNNSLLAEKFLRKNILAKIPQFGYTNYIK